MKNNAPDHHATTLRFFGNATIRPVMSTVLDFLRKDYEKNKMTIDLVRYIALWGHPLYYVICAVLLPQPYESFELRFGSAISFIPLLFYKRYPDAATPWLNIYWYIWLTFTFPFIFTYLTLMTDLSGLWLVAETVMLITFIAFIPNHFVMTILLATGLAAASSTYTSTTGNHFVITAEIIEYFVSIPIAILLGFVLNYSAKKGAMAHERNHMLQSLAASIAHEMRNPLGQIRQCLNSIQSILPPFHPDTTSVTLGTSSINDIYHRVAHGQMAVKRGVQVIDMILGEIRKSPVDLNSFSYLSAASITRKALDEYGYESAQERERVSLHTQENFIFHISETLFIFVIFNLLKNALYYLGSHANTEITIRLKKGDTCNSILFRDTGPGIAKEDLPYIFDSFNSKGKKGGTGIGLSYCKRIMQAFGGDITCRSEKDRYTEFTLSFPVVDSGNLERFNAEVISNALPDFEGKNILIVDDEQSYRTLLTRHLQPLNVTIDTAQGGLEALEKTRMCRYALIIMDLNMPDLNGYKTAELIRQDENRQNLDGTPIIACSAEPAYIAKTMAQKSGMQAMLTKPCSRFELVNTMRSALHSGISREKTKQIFSKARILLIEDSALNRDLMAMTLKDAGLHVKIAVNGHDGWQQLHKEEFDLVITDIHMPEIDGLELTRRLRNSDNDHLRELPIIGLSGSAEEEKAAKKAGMNEFKLKTDSPESLLNAIGKSLSNSANETLHTSMEKDRGTTSSAVNLQASADTFGLPLHEIEKLFHTFLAESYAVPGIMQQALTQNDVDILQSEAHKLKGSASLFGANAIVAAAETIERNCLNGKTDNLQQEVATLKSALLELTQ
ncbi:ATP-binding response regulator [Prosthecochloris sp. CIB 2401]|uniref:ATP-binding response regulator n=1 Tax=Prosthecochloris sp. CIB 2401 TaxID=1868325 RepID=UPI00080AB9FB|nr:response regulator [Prosthecochloris sp. CIB 2401]ANT65729.1 CAI-1 autoinducer sensor kinase/phosphatase CqsS [Prosthecochloris sp. CIB 2401]